MRSANVPHDHYREGFIVGWQTVKGTDVSVPEGSPRPATPQKTTLFLIGVKAGLFAAGVDIDDIN